MGSLRAQNIKVQPHDVYFEAGERVCFDFKSAVAADLHLEYMTLYTPTGGTIVIWFDLDAADPVAPATGTVATIEVDITTGMTVAQMLTAVDAAHTAAGGEPTTGYKATIDGDVIVFERINDTGEVATEATSSTTGIAADVITKGGGVYLGLLDGDITFTPTAETLDITAHQTGSTVLSKIIQNVGAEVELTLKEVTKDIYQELFKVSGGEYTPTVGTTLYGYGTAKIASNLLKFAKRLRLHPVSKANNDRSEDWCFWLTIPELGGMTFSGENPQTLPVTFTAFPDDSRNENISVFSQGDWQAVLDN